MKEFEEVRLKLKILEGKRAEDREKYKDYPRIKAELEQLNIIKGKMTGSMDMFAVNL
jgi:dynactin 1